MNSCTCRVDDQFFRLSEMADFLDKMDKMESTTSRGRKAAPEDSDDDDDDENENDEDIDLFRDPDDVCVGFAVWNGFSILSFRVSFPSSPPRLPGTLTPSLRLVGSSL